MRCLAVCLFVAVCLLLGPVAVMAAPTVEVISTSKDIEKAHAFQLLVKVTADEKLTDLVVAPIYPEGFCEEAVRVPGVTVGERPKPDHVPNAGQSADTPGEIPECTGIKDIAHVASLEKSSFIIPFNVYPPDSQGKPETGSKRSFYSTREPKHFAFNISYKTERGGKAVQGSATQQIELRYTTSMGYYLLSGLFGVFLGYMVKTATKDKDEIGAVVGKVNGVGAKTLTFLYQVLVGRLPMLLTLMVIGFGVLLALAKDSMPVSSWHQAIALGISLGILGDEKLISKIK